MASYNTQHVRCNQNLTVHHADETHIPSIKTHNIICKFKNLYITIWYLHLVYEKLRHTHNEQSVWQVSNVKNTLSKNKN